MSGPTLRVTKADAAFAAVALATMGIAYYTQANLMFWVCGLLGGGLLASLVVPALVLRRLEVERQLPGEAMVDEPATVHYRLRNGKHWLPALNLTVGEELPGQSGFGRGESTGQDGEGRAALAGPPRTWVAHVGPGQEVIAGAPVLPVRRGRLELGEVWVETGFPFGLLRRRRVLRQPQSLVVFPKRYRLKPGLIQRLARHESGGRVPARRIGGVDEFYGLREYRPGDGLKAIDWKQSAKGRGLVARQLTMLSPPRVLLGLDFDQSAVSGLAGEAATALEEAAICLAASVIIEAEAAGFRVGLWVLGAAAQAHPIAGGKAHVDRMLTTLGLLGVRARASDQAGRRSVSVWVRPTGGAAPGSKAAEGRAGALGGALLLTAAEMGNYLAVGEAEVEPATSEGRA